MTYETLIKWAKKQDPKAAVEARLIIGKKGDFTQLSDPFLVKDFAATCVAGRVSLIVDIDKADAQMIAPLYGVGDPEDWREAAEKLETLAEMKEEELDHE